MFDRFSAWANRTMPTREQLSRSRWIPARVLESQLWRFTRRSVPRGVALGLLVGVLLPVAQIVFAAILSFPVRANVPVAALTTFVTNPFTTPFIWAASYKIGAWFLRIDAAVAGGPIDHLMQITDLWSGIQWLTSEGKVLALGLVIFAVVSAAVGYLATSWAWRWRVGTVRNRQLRRRERRAAAAR